MAKLMRYICLNKKSSFLSMAIGVSYLLVFLGLQNLVVGQLDSRFDDEIAEAHLEVSFSQLLWFGKGATGVSLFVLDPTESRSSYFHPSPRGTQSHLVRGCPNFGSSRLDKILGYEPIGEWVVDRDWDHAVSTYGVVPIASYGREPLVGRVLGIALSERRMYLAKSSKMDSTGGRLVSVPIDINGGCSVTLPINDIECKINIDLSLRHAFRLTKQKAKELFNNRLVELTEDLVYCPRVRFLGIVVPGVTCQLDEDSKMVCVGFDLIRRFRSEFDFTNGSEMERATWKIDPRQCADVSSQLFKYDFECSMNEYGMRLDKVFEWGLLRDDLRKDDFLIAVNGVNVAHFPKCILEELIATTALNGGVFRIIRGQDEMDIDMKSQPDRLISRNKYFNRSTN